MPFDHMPGPSGAFYFFFAVIATGVVTVFGMAVVKGLGQWRANNEAPLRSVDAMVVSRRQDLDRHGERASTMSNSRLREGRSRCPQGQPVFARSYGYVRYS